jgi:hypothetical protein
MGTPIQTRWQNWREDFTQLSSVALRPLEKQQHLSCTFMYPAHLHPEFAPVAQIDTFDGYIQIATELQEKFGITWILHQFRLRQLQLLRQLRDDFPVGTRATYTAEHKAQLLEILSTLLIVESNDLNQLYLSLEIEVTQLDQQYPHIYHHH